MSEPDFLTETRTSYDAIAEDYAEHFRDLYPARPFDRAMLAVFAEIVGPGEVLDVGSGPGEVTALLHDLGLRVRGLDLSPAMVDLARRDHPHLDFRIGSMTALEVPDSSLAGIVAWYSTIHVPRSELPALFTGFRRALAPAGYLLLAFQVGDEPVHYDEAFGHAVDLSFRRWQPDDITQLLGTLGLTVTARLQRVPVGHESTPQAFLLAQV